MEYSIRHVFDLETGERYDAEVLFKSIQKAQEFRKQFHSGDQIIGCTECKEKATVSTNRFGKVFFKHFPNTPDCILKDPGLTETERKEIEVHIANRETERHKILKKEVGNYLTAVPGVDANTVTVDDRYLKDHLEKRRPDVFCEYNGLKIAFEIQLSRLPARYIFKRHEFYKRNKIYLMWVLDDFKPKESNQTERDIKYLNAHQNHFCFDDHVTPATFIVHFKEGLIDYKNKAYYKRRKESVFLHELNFDSEEFQIFYISLAEEERKTQEEINRSTIEEDIKPALKVLRDFYTTDKENYIPIVENEIAKLNSEAFNVLNQRVCGEDSSLFFRLLQGEGKPYFFKYMLGAIRFNKNLNTRNSEKKNLLEAILSHPKFPFRGRIKQLMFAEGYKLSGSDNIYITSCVIANESRQEREMRIIKIHVYNYLKSLDLIELYDKMEGPIMVMLTARYNMIIGFGFKNFIEVANNAVHNYKNQWHYIERVLRHYKRLDALIENDKNGTFREKLKAYHNGATGETFSGERLLIKLFPAVFDPASSSTEWFHVGMIEESLKSV